MAQSRNFRNPWGVYTQTTVTGLGINLVGGHQYWIGLQNNLNDPSAYSSYIGTDNAADTTAFQIDNLHEYFTAGIQATAFTIQETHHVPSIPEVPTWALMVLGFGALGVAALPPRKHGSASSGESVEEGLRERAGGCAIAIGARQGPAAL